MKKILLLFSLLSFTQMKAYCQNYSFSYTTGTYSEITGGTPILTASNPYNDSITLGYNFTMNGVTSNKLQVTTSGRITTGPYLGGTSPWFLAFDGGDVTKGSYQYTTNGAAGEHITKIQFKNNSFGHEWGNGYQSKCNFQIWLYEKNNVIEVRYGASNIVDMFECYQGASGPTVGMPGIYAAGGISAPTTATTPSALNGTPANGSIYRFGIPSTSVSQLNKIMQQNINVYPVPANNLLHIHSDNSKRSDVHIFDMTGKLLVSFPDHDFSKPVDITSLNSGTYILKTSKEAKVIFTK